MRAGGASLTAALGIPDRLIMRQGGWRSEKLKNNYIHETKDALLHVSRSFALLAKEQLTFGLKAVFCHWCCQK